MAASVNPVLRELLVERRRKLDEAAVALGEDPDLARLIRDVDAALERMETGGYGMCEVCRDPVEPERLIANPLEQFCLDHLTATEQRALQDDLDLATRIQNGLLPEPNLRFGEWSVAYHYEAAGAVSGDYCDVVPADEGSVYFILGDVSGKGVAASMLMAHLHAMFRALIPIGLPLNELVERASRVFCESTLPMHFATLVCGKASVAGKVEICNAGHLPPLLVHKGDVTPIEATGLPIGLFSDERFSVARLQLFDGDTLLLHTDGLSEARDASGAEYGIGRLARLAGEHHDLPPRRMIAACLNEVAAFCGNAPNADDVTVMAIRRDTREP